MMSYSNNNNSKVVPLLIAIFVFGGLVIVGIHNFFIIKDNSFRMVLNILGLIINSLMLILSSTFFKNGVRKSIS